MDSDHKLGATVCAIAAVLIFAVIFTAQRYYLQTQVNFTTCITESIKAGASPAEAEQVCK